MEKNRADLDEDHEIEKGFHHSESLFTEEPG